MKKIIETTPKLGVVATWSRCWPWPWGRRDHALQADLAAYSPFVNGGRKVEPHLIELVQDREGKVIFRADKRDCIAATAGFNGDESPRIPRRATRSWTRSPPIRSPRCCRAWSSAAPRPAGRVAGRPLGGKTGTTNEYRSAWFMGFSPNLVVGVFVGFDDNRSLGEGETGAVAAVPIFIDFMQEALKGKPVVDFKPPKNAKFAMVRGIREAFRPGTEPKVSPSADDRRPAALFRRLARRPDRRAQRRRSRQAAAQGADPRSGLY
jgi:penicillin-binding protein 1A